MDDKIDFITYCIEEYKEHENLTGREVIDLFTRYDIIPYIKSAYNALHVMGGAAITGDIKSLIAGIRDNSEGAAGRAGKGSCLTERATKTP